MMRGMLLVVASIALTVLCWGLYGPTLHNGQADMSDVAGEYARLRPFVCVGLAYFAIGVIVPAALLATRGEQGEWTTAGATKSLLAGALGAIGALGIILAFNFGGRPSFVMPLVFGGAPVVNAFLTIYWAKRLKEIGPVFLAGLLMVVMGAVTVLLCKPGEPAHSTEATPTAVAEAESIESEASEGEAALAVTEAGALGGGRFLMQLLSIGLVVGCWGAYGPVLHHGQAAMKQSRLRPLLCVGLAYFAIAVLAPQLLLSTTWPEASSYTLSGSLWSLGAGAAGAIGALGIILAFNSGGRPMYVMPLVFGGAPVVNTLATVVARGGLTEMAPLTLGGFLAGLILVIAGAALVLIFAPKGPPPKQAQPTPATDTPPTAPADAKPA